jgi:hypothetical protein
MDNAGVRKGAAMRILAALALVTAALAVPTAAWAYGSEVSAYSCYLSGGQVTRPAGTDITIRQGWLTTTRKYDLDFIHAQETFVSVNGGPLIDLSRDWTTPREYGSDWITWVFYPTRIVLAPGQSMTFHYTSGLKRQVFDGFGYAGPGTIDDTYCTVTGA